MSLAPPALELWGGVECTVNRVGDQYLDQLERSGYCARGCDVELLVELGIRAVRHPVLWERHAHLGLHDANWSEVTRPLSRLRAARIEPIVGLLHHGSGPRTTSLLDPGFPEALAAYAGAVAERLPWVRRWTPINEPLTTARFSALYGHWYPHARDDRAFARAVVNQARAIALAMREIRRANPAAELVQTEDVGRTYSTTTTRDQAAFDNERRWVVFDLLAGRVDGRHPMSDFLQRSGIARAELERFREEPCPPDLVGINHYVTSDRFLDDRLDRYPAHAHGGNGREAYADVEAVRVLAHPPGGVRLALDEAWARYRLPLAITEAHLGCTREQQLRWLNECWLAATSARRDGLDVRAVTAWALLGAFDWHSLVTRAEGRYESGAYDVRGPRPRATAVATMIRELATAGQHAHPVLASAGWWRGGSRLAYPPVLRDGSDAASPAEAAPRAGAPLLITGGAGTLGEAFARLCTERGLAHRRCRRQELDITDPASIRRILEQERPWGVVNAAGYVRVDDAERESERCQAENVEGPALLADACAAHGIPFLTFSSDLVFDGRRLRPYVEGDAVGPLNVYGCSKAEAERRVLARMPEALVVRTSAFFGPWDAHNFVTTALRTLGDRHRFAAADDQVVSPTYVPDLVHACLDLLIDGAGGVWHVANGDAVSWVELALLAAELARLDPELIDARSTHALGVLAPRPRYSVLGSERGVFLPPLRDALRRYLSQRPATDGGRMTWT